MSVQDKIAELERQVARKKALVNAKITLPKDTPDDVKTEINALIQEALLKLAETDSVGAVAGQFTAEEMAILKALANRALTKPKANDATETKVTSLNGEASQSETIVIGDKALGKINKNPVADGKYVGREAEILSLDSVPVRQRGKVASMERCKVIEHRDDGLLHILTKGGIRFNISPDDLNFELSEAN